MSIENHSEANAIKTSEKQEEDRVRRHAQAQEFANQGSFESALESFSKEPGLLDEMVGLLQAREAGILQEAPYLSPHDWQVLTVLDLFDSATFEHCKRTFYLAKEKLEHGSQSKQMLSYLLSNENLSVADVLRACLLHDCGKMCLDKTILNDTHTDEEWIHSSRHYFERTENGRKLTAKIGDLATYLATHPGLRPVHVVPFEASFDTSSAEDMARLAIIQAKGIDTSLTLADIIAPHQERSGEILRRDDMNDPAADLVENHHPREEKDGGMRPIEKEKYPVGVSLLRTSIESSEGIGRAYDILRIADIYDAYNSDRGYKSGHPMLSTFAYILHETDRGVIDERVAEGWVQDSLSNINEHYIDSFITELEEKKRTSDKEQFRSLDRIIKEERAAEKFLRDRGMFSKNTATHKS
jgi:HD-GYP domain-containing protein (c-di-GMP phosphodiesterase class II)